MKAQFVLTATVTRGDGMNRAKEDVIQTVQEVIENAGLDKECDVDGTTYSIEWDIAPGDEVKRK